MNYFEKHLGDWAKDTKGLSMAEDGAYNRLTDHYYATEKPIPDDRAESIAGAHSDDDRSAVRKVLDLFFKKRGKAWTHKRCESEIAKFREKSIKASASAKMRWESGGNANASGMRTHKKRNAHQTPDTNHQPPAPPTPDAAAEKLTAVGVAETAARSIATEYPGKVDAIAARIAAVKPDNPTGYAISIAPGDLPPPPKPPADPARAYAAENAVAQSKLAKGNA